MLFTTLITGVWHQRIVAYLDVASSTILVYDLVLTLDLEIEYIWAKKWSLVTVIYLLQRYLPLFDIAGVVLYREFKDDMSLHDCVTSFRIAAWCIPAGIVLSEVLLAVRLWAVWGRKSSVAIGIFVFLLGCWTPCFVLVNRFIDSIQFATPPVPHFRGCFISGGSHSLYLSWVLMVVYDAGTLIMIVIPGISAFRIGGKSDLYKAVYRDGIIYYIFIFFVSLINIIAISTLPSDLVHMLSCLERVLHSVLTSRAILQIRRVTSELDPTVSTLHSMKFAVRQSRSDD
ncbi:hypothetical protein PM082_004395 [Marasmius tenuissimus]|nr:hypothetical protein PM082_004395 [Marasmius tenuissimus]